MSAPAGRSFVIPARSARAFRVERGEHVRIVALEGPRVADVNVYNADDLQEHFSAGATRRLYGIYLSGREPGLESRA